MICTQPKELTTFGFPQKQGKTVEKSLKIFTVHVVNVPGLVE